MAGLLSGYKALVTGGTRGIGEAIARQLERDSATVIVTGTSPDSVPPSGCDYRAARFEDDEALSALVSEVADLEIDILINNAGINKIAPFADIDPGDFDRIYKVNVLAPFLLSQAAIPHMKRKGWGRIVTISSIFGKISKERRAPYSASKFAVDGMMAALSAEVASHGILANCVAPGFIDTSLTHEILGKVGVEELVERIPIKRLGTPEEVATLVAWVAGPKNTYLTGQNIVIDGGFTRV